MNVYVRLKKIQYIWISYSPLWLRATKRKICPRKSSTVINIIRRHLLCFQSLCCPLLVVCGTGLRTEEGHEKQLISTHGNMYHSWYYIHHQAEETCAEPAWPDSCFYDKYFLYLWRKSKTLFQVYFHVRHLCHVHRALEMNNAGLTKAKMSLVSHIF